MNAFKRSFLLTFVSSLSLLVAFFAGFLLRDWQQRRAATFPVFDEAYRLIEGHAFTPLPTGQAMQYGAIRGMVQAYGSAVNDPHTSFLEPPQAELENDTLAGKFGGIGVRLSNDADGNYVLYPFPNGPAAKAGIQDGDRLLAVDDLAITPQTPVDQLTAAVRGPIGKKVRIVVGRAPGFEPVSFDVKREEVALPSVTFHIDADEARLGVIEVNAMASTTIGEIFDAATDLQARGATALALDLRNNGGGLLDVGIEVARLFLKDGIVIEQQYRGEAVETFKVNKPGKLSDIPMVVLINGGTASAAEIVAGALQAHGRARLIGETSYGKNTIQLVYELSDQSSLHVTAAEWRIPGLDAPRPGKGLTPDIPAASGATPDEGIRAAIQVLFP
ncbi:MAG: S41 family peptidase [Chloroflexota bacterium]